MTVSTPTVYTPFDYKWILDVELADREGNPIGSDVRHRILPGGDSSWWGSQEMTGFGPG
jgi:hypothetical protein